MAHPGHGARGPRGPRHHRGLGAKLGDSPVAPAIRRVVFGGLLALGATYGIGALLGVAVG
ncbi:hypothetical protein [Tessaracoccus coleopterorum]|uniref:hypothetical protein n=1 Tax=Tessaracoccus coleopterorum TaxID=2714950 RepID=UPI002F91868C